MPESSKKSGWWRSLRQLYFVRLLLLGGILIAFRVGSVLLATHALITSVDGLFSKPVAVLLPFILPIIVAAVALYWLGVRVFEGRDVSEISVNRAKTYLLPGFLSGFLGFAIVFGIMWALSYAKFRAFVGFAHVSAVALILIAGVIFEELIARGVIFRIIEVSLGTCLALALSAVFFGLLHVGNKGATWISTFSLMIGGIVLGLCYTLSKSLWLPIGVHFGWNLSLALLGIAVSGHQVVPSLFIFDLSGPQWATGGLFGLEASIFAVLLFAIIAVLLWTAAVRESRWIPLRFRMREIRRKVATI